MSEKTIALLGQPNSGKSSLFNGLTGSRQHVGNWPGKTVERKDGSFVHKDTTYKIIDLPGTYSLSANSDEEVVTRNYIASGQADVVCILADASQLNRSLFMLADYTGIRVPVVLLLNMMDVAKSQGKQIDTNGIAKSLGIPVVPLVAADKKQYGTFFRMLESIDKNASTLDEKRLAQIYQNTIGTAFDEIKALLDAIHDNMYTVAEKNLEDNTFDLKTIDEVKEMASGRGGFARTKWCGSLECELKMKEQAGVSSRCMPLKQSGTTGKCVCCGKECTTDIYWGVAY